MAFSRNSMIAAIAGSVSLAILTGCPQQPTSPTTPGTSASPTTPGTSASPTTPGTSASPTTPVGSESPGASPSVVPSASNLVPTTVNGTVYDEEGAPVTAAKVRIESLNPSNPFDSTVDVTNGAYVANQVPAGVQVRITAFRENWTSRSRVTTLLPIGEGRRNEVNFGGNADTEDPSGPAYFISDYPEVTAVEPADNADNVNPSSVSVRLTLSEPLDATNQRRFADAIRVLPGDFRSAGFAQDNVATLADFPEASQAATPAADLVLDTTDGNAVYFIDEDSTFLDDEDTKAQVAWDSTGTIATLTFNAPLLANEDESNRYVVALFASSQANPDEIEDRAGNNLGMGFAATPLLDSAYTNGGMILFAFREPTLAVSNAVAGGDDDTRWRATHEHFSEFEVAEDDTDPTLTGVTVTTPTVNGNQVNRISLTFSEPMAAYLGANVKLGSIDGTAIPAGGDMTDALLDNFTFAVGETAADLDDVSLDGDSPATAAYANGNSIGGTGEREREYFLSEAAVGQVTLSVNPDDPKTLRLEVPFPGGSTTPLFDNSVNAIKVRVEGLSDPAGNSITEASADANEKVGSI